MYPDDSIQYFIDDWWIEDTTYDYCHGRLIKAFLPHVDQIPKKLIPTGRSDPTDHSRANFSIEPLRIKQSQQKPSLPVAALPAYSDEVNAIYRAKRRPAIIVCEGGESVDRALTLGKPKWQTSPTILVAPYYGVDEGGGSRSGFNPVFIMRVRRCLYPQFMWDMLPIKGSEESILRLDHIQPIGKHHDTIEITNYRLSQDAILIFDEWINWLIYGNFPEDSLLFDFKNGIESFEKP